MTKILSALLLYSLTSCGHEPAPQSVPTAATANNARTTPTSAPTSTPALEQESAQTVFDRIRPGLLRCYEDGRKTTPTMLDGKLTLNGSIEPTGGVSCAIPTEDSGLTQEVEDCMSSELAAAKLSRQRAPWSIAIPVAVEAGALKLGRRSPAARFSIESVETHRMPDAFDTLETLVPDLHECLHGVDRSAGVREVVVGARVSVEGKPTCALVAPSSGTLPLSVRECTSSLFARTKFPPPKGGMGLILVPIALMKR